MERTEIVSLYRQTPADGTVVTVCGWAKTVRDSKKIGFISLTDGSCYKPVQVVFEADKLANYAEVAKSGLYTSFEVTGRLVLTMAAGLPQYDFVLACDIYTELSGEQPLTSAIPSGYSAYITDVNGNVIFYQGAFDAAAIDPSEMRRRALALHQTAAEHISGPGSSCGSEADSDSACYFIERISMENEPDRAAYYCHDPQTNWITMITAPDAQRLQLHRLHLRRDDHRICPPGGLDAPARVPLLAPDCLRQRGLKSTG